MGSNNFTPPNSLNRMKNHLQFWISLLVFSVLSSCLYGQTIDESLKPVTNTFVIKNVNITQKPGQSIELGTVVIQDGLITAVGKSVGIPKGAQVVEADSMYLYAGFIDALSHAGIPKPKEDGNNRGGRNSPPPVKDPGNPPNDKAGIQPERQASDMIDPKDKSISDLRKLGFTTVHTVPYGRMLPGSGAIIQLSEGKKDALVLDGNASLFAQLSPARRMFPATIIGVMSKFRELYKQAEQAKNHTMSYQSNPNGMKRPEYEALLQAFYPVIDQQKSVFFKANKLLDAHRVLDLQRDLGFPLVIADLKQGWDVTDRLQAANASVVLSLDLPSVKEDKKEDKKKKDGAKKPSPQKVAVVKEVEKKAETEEKAKEEDEETAALKKRQQEELKKYYSQAANFKQKGIPFGFATISAKSKDIRPNLKKMMDNGLSEKDALAALTTEPAKMLGLSRLMGTVENGKIANLVISDKPYFDEKANVRYVFVDGQMFEYEVKKKKKGNPDAKVALAGKWSYHINVPGQETDGVMTIEGEDGSFKGKLANTDSGDEMEMENIELDGNVLTFTTSFNAGGDRVLLDFELVIEGDALEGSVVAGEFGTFDVEGERVP